MIKKKKIETKTRKIVQRTANNRGITLVALVLTIIILIILATISINLAFGDNGLINKAKLAKEMTTNSMAQEEEKSEAFLELINEVLEGGVGEVTNTIEPPPDVPKEPYVDEALVEAPQLTSGMTPVKWDGTNWVETDIYDSSWYDYTSKKWANVVLEGADGLDADGDQQVFNDDGTLNENSNYSMLVWIPRYAYKITSNYHGNTAGNIDIVFLSKDNYDKTGNNYNSYTTYPSVSGGAMTDYVVHPAFDCDQTATSGFWVGKFETSHTGCTTDANTGSNNTNTTNLKLQIKPGVTSWRSINISNIFQVCLNMNNTNNAYGLPDDTVADPHLIKNSEWGAVAYLSQSADYGKASEIFINNSSSFITGSSAGNASASEGVGTTTDYKSENGQQASTTGNVYGVYDMNGGSLEYVSAYVNNNNIQTGQLYSDGKNLIDMVNSGNTKYVDVYRIGTTDSDRDNYIALQPTTGQGTPNINTGHYGDAIWETSSDSASGLDVSWYGDHSRFPLTTYPYLIRSGANDDGTSAGIFHFTAGNGTAGSNVSFHVAISIYN